MENAKADKDPNQDASLRRLVALYPACFHLSEHERRPLRVGISRELEAADTGIAPVQLRQALGWYCGSIGYLQNMVAGADRIGLNGLPSGVVTEAEAAHAKKRVSAQGG
jgi:ProP effector